jgi:hypothetical protein
MKVFDGGVCLLTGDGIGLRDDQLVHAFGYTVAYTGSKDNQLERGCLVALFDWCGLCECGKTHDDGKKT